MEPHGGELEGLTGLTEANGGLGRSDGYLTGVNSLLKRREKRHHWEEIRKKRRENSEKWKEKERNGRKGEVKGESGPDPQRANDTEGNKRRGQSRGEDRKGVLKRKGRKIGDAPPRPARCA